MTQSAAPNRADDALNPTRLEKLLAGFAGRRVLIVGDCMLDEYVIGASNRASPEAPVMVVNHARTEYAAGGASNVAANIVSLAGRASIVALVGEDPQADILREQLAGLGVNVEGLVIASDRPTTLKTRILARNQQVVRVDRESRRPAPPETEDRLISGIRSAIGDSDGVIFSDYAKGALTERVVAVTVTLARERGLPIFANAKPANIGHFKNLDLISVNETEAQAITGQPLETEAEVERAGYSLCSQAHCASVLITRGGAGLSLFYGNQPARHVPALRQDVFDVAGAGDSVIAAISLARVAGANWPQAAEVANLAGHAKVRKRGVVPVTRREIQAVMRLALNGQRPGAEREQD